MTPFLVVIGMVYAVLSVMAVFAFRSADAPLWSKIVLSVVGVALSCATPVALNEAAGYPIATTYENLSPCIALRSFAVNEKAKTVSLWIDESEGQRTYKIELDARVHDALASARAKLAKGSVVHLCKETEDGKPIDGSSDSDKQSRMKINTDGDMPLKASGE